MYVNSMRYEPSLERYMSNCPFLKEHKAEAVELCKQLKRREIPKHIAVNFIIENMRGSGDLQILVTTSSAVILYIMDFRSALSRSSPDGPGPPCGSRPGAASPEAVPAYILPCASATRQHISRSDVSYRTNTLPSDDIL